MESSAGVFGASEDADAGVGTGAGAGVLCVDVVAAAVSFEDACIAAVAGVFSGDVCVAVVAVVADAAPAAATAFASSAMRLLWRLITFVRARSSKYSTVSSCFAMSKSAFSMTAIINELHTSS